MTTKEFAKILQDKLTSEYGVDLSVASKQQIYRSLALICRQMMSENHKKFQSKAIGTGTKQVYYLCMEFLMGRSLKMSLFNLGLEDVAQNDGQREVEQRRKRCAGQQRLVAAGPVVHPTTCLPEFTTGKPITYPAVCPHPLLFVRGRAAAETACFRRRRTLRGLPEFWTRRSAGFGKNCIDRGKNVLYNKSQEQISAKENYA